MAGSLQASEAACVYAALILHDDGVEITADKMRSLISAAGVDVEPIWPTLFEKALAGKDIGSFLMNVGAGAVAAAPAAGAPAAAGGAAPAEEKKEAKKEEVEEESDEDMGF
ncbi:60S acidic ribosomal protein P1, partial [Quaeritorhiza haematococci]